MTLNQRINWIDWAKVFAIYLVAIFLFYLRVSL